jgi:hypothetical protein
VERQLQSLDAAQILDEEIDEGHRAVRVAWALRHSEPLR